MRIFPIALPERARTPFPDTERASWRQALLLANGSRAVYAESMTVETGAAVGTVLGAVLSALTWSVFFAWANKKMSKAHTYEKSTKIGSGITLALSLVFLGPYISPFAVGEPSQSLETVVLRILAVIAWFPLLLKRARKKDAAASSSASPSTS